MHRYQLGRDIWLWIDPAQFCNLCCELCYTRPSHARQFLDAGSLETYLVRFQDSDVRVREITVNWRGEPLTNKIFPTLLEMICKAFPNVRVQFHTNATLLSEQVATRLCAINQPFHVFLSIDGGNRISHERNRGSGTFDLAVRGGLNLINARKGHTWPQITLYQLDLGVAEADYEQSFMDLSARCDSWQRVVPITATGLASQLSDVSPSTAGLDPTELWLSEPEGTAPRGACFWAGYSLSIAPDGDISVCILSQVDSVGGRLGNLKVDVLDAVLGRAEEFRVNLERLGRKAVPHCARCHKIEGQPRSPRAPRDLRPLAALGQKAAAPP